MIANILVNSVALSVKALTYPFPKAPKVPEGYTLLDETGAPLTLAKTGGGKYPTYIYFLVDGKSYYLPKNVTPDSGSSLVVVAEAVKFSPAETSPTLGDEAEVSGVAEALIRAGREPNEAGTANVEAFNAENPVAKKPRRTAKK